MRTDLTNHYPLTLIWNRYNNNTETETAVATSFSWVASEGIKKTNR